MTWWSYVQRWTGGETQERIARRLDISTPSVGRWKESTPRPENVAAFARAYNRPVLEAFVAAGFLTSDEAGERPSAPPSLVGLNDDDLLKEVGRRMQRSPNEGQQPEAQKNTPKPDAGGTVTELPRPTPERYMVDRAADDRANQGRALRDHLDRLSDET